ncbi:MAG TPA: site-specific integrase [Gemmatimonadaceae bacterium]|nr:site-specific integrase [Gemmatimonadaceae bacterium]
MALTKRQLDALRFNPDGATKQILYDGELTGFGVRVYPNGNKSFVLRYGSNGSRKLLTLGKYGELTLQQARELAIDALRDTRHGHDPVEERRARRKLPTLGEFASEYIDLHARPRKRSWKEDQRRLDTYILPKWRTRRIDSITRSHVNALIVSLAAEHAVEANRVWALLSVMCNKAIEWGRVPSDWKNPAHGAGTAIKRERSRERWIKPSEMPALIAAIDAERNPFHRAAFRLYLLTGLRRSELLSLQWSNVNLSEGTLYVPVTKSGRSHTLPLSSPARAVFAELPRELNNPHVFPAANGGHMADLKKPWRRVREAAGLSDVRLHDLRRTVGSMMAQDGASLLMVGKVLNHSETRTTERAYAHLGSEAIRDALEKHGARVIDIATRRAS